jgi:hypothetical protein
MQCIHQSIDVAQRDDIVLKQGQWLGPVESVVVRLAGSSRLWSLLEEIGSEEECVESIEERRGADH